MKNNKKILDAHIHISPEISPSELNNFIDETNTDMAVIQAVAHSKCKSLVPEALAMKIISPGKYYVFAAPDLDMYYSNKEVIGQNQKEYIREMIKLGCDGVKLLEGKPQMRKAHPIPDFNEMCWEPFWDYLEHEQIPVMWHVNDPEQFWSSNVSAWLVKQGWAYDDSFINNEAQYSQVIEVLDRHPKLRICFAHFFFMSAQLERLSGILDKYPNVMIDLTPGIEMYENFSKNSIESKEFFIKYQDRICYGTDIGGRCILTNEGCAFNKKECEIRPQIVRYFLEGNDEKIIESDGNYIIEKTPFVMQPLNLDGSVLEKIYLNNIINLIGKESNAVDIDGIKQVCNEQKSIVSDKRALEYTISTLNTYL